MAVTENEVTGMRGLLCCGVAEAIIKRNELRADYGELAHSDAGQILFGPENKHRPRVWPTTCERKFKNSKSVVWRPLQLRNGCALKSRGRIVESIYFTIKGHLHKPLCRVFFSLISNLYKYSPQESSMGGANGKTLHTSTSKTASISFLACHCIHAGK